jgi:hypothetical protein
MREVLIGVVGARQSRSESGPPPELNLTSSSAFTSEMR